VDKYGPWKGEGGWKGAEGAERIMGLAKLTRVYM